MFLITSTTNPTSRTKTNFIIPHGDGMKSKVATGVKNKCG